MTERREPTISNASSPRHLPEDPLGTVPIRTAKPAPVKAASSPLAPFAILLAFAALGLGGFCFWQMVQFQQVTAQAALTQQASEARIAELEKRLSATGETSEQSLAALQAKLATNSQEITKLWAANNEVKTKLSASLEQVIASVTEKLQATSKDADSKSKAAVTEAKAALSDLQSEVKVLQDLVEAHQSALGKEEDARKDQSAKIAEIAKKLKALDTDLSERMRNNENAIESIDAFRLQVNREILKLKGG